MKIAKRIMIIFGVTIAIIAFATWWPSYTAYRIRGYDIAAKEDLKKLYKAAQSYFIEKPIGTHSTWILLRNTATHQLQTLKLR